MLIDEVIDIGYKLKREKIDSEYKRSSDLFLAVDQQRTLEEEAPTEIWKSLFLAACSAVESILSDICKHIYEANCENTGEGLVHSIILKLCDYRDGKLSEISENFDISDNETYKDKAAFKKLADHIVSSYKVRNCIAHTNGKLLLCGKIIQKLLKK